MRAPLVLLLLLGACGDSGARTLTLSWQFADGRRCTDAGAVTVQLSVGELMLGAPACLDGEAPAAAMIAHVPESGSLAAIARSPQMGELYRGELALDLALLPATVELYATGAR